MTANRLIHDDNLKFLKDMENGSDGLIYLVPLFFSNRNYEIVCGITGEILSFQVRWAERVSHYID